MMTHNNNKPFSETRTDPETDKTITKHHSPHTMMGVNIANKPFNISQCIARCLFPAKADDDFSRRVQFNTVVSGVMELCNEIGKFEVSTEADRSVVGEALRTALLVISPVAPHIAHSLWATLGQETLLVEERWPLLDESALTQTTITMVVQVQGKVRGQVRVAADASKDVILDTAKTEPNVIKHIDGKEIVKEIVVPDKLVNIVVR